MVIITGTLFGCSNSNEGTARGYYLLTPTGFIDYEIRSFDLEGNFIFSFPFQGKLTIQPTFCTGNQRFYYVDVDEGFNSIAMDGTGKKETVPGAVTFFTIIGTRVYYSNGKDGILYSCGLEGEDQQAVFEDPATIYTTENVLQNLSLVIDIDDDMMYYAAKEMGQEGTETIKAFDMSSGDISIVGTAHSGTNVELLGVVGESLYYTTWPLSSINDKTLMAVDVHSLSVTKIGAVANAAINDAHIYYSGANYENIYEYKDGKSVQIAQIPAVNLYACDDKVFFNFPAEVPEPFITSKDGVGTPYPYVVLSTGEISQMPADFIGAFITESKE